MILFQMNVKISKILIPVDGSEASMNACDYAIFRAKSVLSNLYGETVLHTSSYHHCYKKYQPYIDS
jgi:nucleotide-binding universal stress UspA family protein